MTLRLSGGHTSFRGRFAMVNGAQQDASLDWLHVECRRMGSNPSSSLCCDIWIYPCDVLKKEIKVLVSYAGLQTSSFHLLPVVSRSHFEVVPAMTLAVTLEEVLGPSCPIVVTATHGPFTLDLALSWAISKSSIDRTWATRTGSYDNDCCT